MVSFNQFIGVLRACLLETKGIEVVLGPYMLTACLAMSHQDWQAFAKAGFDRLQFDIDLRALSGSSTILDLYFASIYRFQLPPIHAMDTSRITANRAHSSSNQTSFLH
jgi:hypothetical protein